jgi:hypothetical protein
MSSKGQAASNMTAFAGLQAQLLVSANVCIFSSSFITFYPQPFINAASTFFALCLSSRSLKVSSPSSPAFLSSVTLLHLGFIHSSFFFQALVSNPGITERLKITAIKNVV